MTVVRNEFERGENNPASILRERVASTAYLWHNYGKSTIGSKEDLEKVPVEPPGGRSTRSSTSPTTRCWRSPAASTRRRRCRWSPSRWASCRGRRACSIRPTPSSRRRTASASSTLRRVGQGQNVIVAYHAVSAAHPDAAALQVLAGVMSGGGGGRGGRGGGGGGAGRPPGQGAGRHQAGRVGAAWASSCSTIPASCRSRPRSTRISRSTRPATPSTRRSTTS